MKLYIFYISIAIIRVQVNDSNIGRRQIFSFCCEHISRDAKQFNLRNGFDSNASYEIRINNKNKHNWMWQKSHVHRTRHTDVCGATLKVEKLVKSFVSHSVQLGKDLLCFNKINAEKFRAKRGTTFPCVDFHKNVSSFFRFNLFAAVAVDVCCRWDKPRRHTTCACEMWVYLTKLRAPCFRSDTKMRVDNNWTTEISRINLVARSAVRTC